MIALKVEQIGDRVAVVLTEDALKALGVGVGGTLHLEPYGTAAALAVVPEASMEERHARGRAFLKRYHKTFEALAK